ncbi:hypothetical protein ACVW0K_007353 [Streptomyces filamentosus]
MRIRKPMKSDSRSNRSDLRVYRSMVVGSPTVGRVRGASPAGEGVARLQWEAARMRLAAGFLTILTIFFVTSFSFRVEMSKEGKVAELRNGVTYTQESIGLEVDVTRD